jgi:hypothetical protein
MTLKCMATTSVEEELPQVSAEDKVRLKSPAKMRFGLSRMLESETFIQKANLSMQGP